MTDRRPHWDADLIEAVADAVDYTLLAGQMYDVIAAVEDWLGPVEEMVNDGERVKRVRELHTSEAPDGYEYEFDITVRGGHWVQCDCCDSAHCCDKAVRTCLACGDDMPCPTLRVLDGDSDE